MIILIIHRAVFVADLSKSLYMMSMCEKKKQKNLFGKRE